MSNDTIIGHDRILERFARWVAAGRLASTYLFTGPPGTGKYTTARYIARCLLCEGTPRDELVACNRCPACVQVEGGTHPDLLEVHRLPDKNFLLIEQFVGDDEHRMQEGLCPELALRPFRGGCRVAIINDADFLNVESANCLLKTLEEPPAHALIFLISHSEHRQLPTIRSRSQIIRFAPLAVADAGRLLERLDLVPEGVLAEELAAAAHGSLQLAAQLAEEGALEFRAELLSRLASLDPTDEDFADVMSRFVDAAGQEAAARRNRLRIVVEISTRFYRQLMLALAGIPEETDRQESEAVRRAMDAWRGDIDTVSRCIDRCLSVPADIQANVSQAILIEYWLSDLGRIMRGEAVAV